MREIKFRAWFKPKKFMLYNIATNEWVIGFDGKVYDHNNEFQSCSIDEDEGMLLMQWTGLKDKNGKEIYEGDIVQFEKNGEVIQLPVEYDEYWAEFSPLSWERGPCRRYEFEVIGNKYET